MILKIAWRNIWRNRLRSSVIIVALSLGLVAGIFSSAFVQGMMKQKIESVISKEMSDFQVHHSMYREELLPNLIIKDGELVQKDIESNKNVIATTGRVLIEGPAVSTSHREGMIRLVGIDPGEEAAVTGLKEDLVEGEYFIGIKKNPILISSKTAEEYGVELKGKINFRFLDVNGSVQQIGFRVVGIYDTGNPMMDGMKAYALRDDVRKHLGLENGYHELAISLDDHDQAEPLAISYQDKYQDLEIISWLDLALGMRMMIETMGVYTVIIVGIILFALLFSILNTMLMAVLERTREIGMLMAVGMAKQKVFSMIMLETLFLSLIGGPIGILVSYLLISYFGTAGINLGDAAYGEMGFSNIIYPYLESSEYVNVAIMVFFMTLFAAIYPSIKALRLKPVEAIRK